MKMMISGWLPAALYYVSVNNQESTWRISWKRFFTLLKVEWKLNIQFQLKRKMRIFPLQLSSAFCFFPARIKILQVVKLILTSDLNNCCPQSVPARVRLVQNEASGLLINTHARRRHISRLPQWLRRLPVKFRTELKINTFLFNSMHILAPKYISDNL